MDNIRKILIFRLCCFGDVIMLTPAIAAIKKRYPDAEIDFAASSWIERLMPYIVDINRAVLYDGPFEKKFFSKIFSTVRFIRTLRKNNYDMAFLAHRTSFYGLILKIAGIKYRLGFSETRFLTHTCEYDEEMHFVDRHLKVLNENGIIADNSSLILKRLENRNDILRKNGITEDSFVIGIFPFGGSNPGTQMEIKKWGLDNYLNLIRRVSSDYPEKKIILFEGTLENEKISSSGLPPNTIKLVINPDLISACSIFVSGDTGPLYMAEAFSVSTLSIFGPTDAMRVAPKSTSGKAVHKYIWKKPYCSPCYTSVTAFDVKNTKYWAGNSFICYTGTHECIKSISVDEVNSELNGIINKLNNS